MTAQSTARPARSARSARRSGGRPRWLPGLLMVPPLLLLGALVLAVALFVYRAFAAGSTGEPGVVEALRSGALDSFYWEAMLRTALLSLGATVLSCLISLLVASALVVVDRRAVTAATMALLFSPLVVSMAVRGYGWLLILDQPPVARSFETAGDLLGFLGVSPALLATVLVLAHAMMPITAFPLLTRMREIHRLQVTRAARDLGARSASVFWKVTVPLAAPTALRVGGLAFGLAMGAFGIPAIIGRGRVQVVSELVYQNLLAVSWPTAFVRLAMLLLVTAVVVTPLFALAKRLGRRAAPRRERTA
ncbi:ABC transporter permease subunit [Streptosporangium sp. NPDC051022]|uniref:ABC transporter permease n=1 Tax=Streptosporangium sp. NPDC051022 TaxID=3155752 RepID=UPI00343EF0B2